MKNENNSMLFLFYINMSDLSYDIVNVNLGLNKNTSMQKMNDFLNYYKKSHMPILEYQI